MSTSSNTSNGPRYPPMLPAVHPGEVLRDCLEEGMGLSLAEAARRLGISRMSLHRIVSGQQGVTAEMALRIDRLFGNGPELWLNLQRDFDLARARESIAAELAKITPLSPPADQRA
jgi:antitoxin HigA-1